MGKDRMVVKLGLKQIPKDGLQRLQRELREHPERVLVSGSIVEFFDGGKDVMS